MIAYILCFLAAWLLGSIPTAAWISQHYYHKDLRCLGSGNAGATNAWRVFGWRAGLLVLIIDVGKGVLAVVGPALFLGKLTLNPWELIPSWFLVLCGFIAIIGHSKSIFLGWHGGKSVATSAGVLLAMMPFPATLAGLVFVVVYTLTRLVSLASLVAAALLPILVFFAGEVQGAWYHTPHFVLALLVMVVVIVRHRANIIRLWHGREYRM